VLVFISVVVQVSVIVQEVSVIVQEVSVIVQEVSAIVQVSVQDILRSSLSISIVLF